MADSRLSGAVVPCWCLALRRRRSKTSLYAMLRSVRPFREGHLTPRVRGAQYGAGATVSGRPRHTIRATTAPAGTSAQLPPPTSRR